MRTNGELHKILVAHLGEEGTKEYEAAIANLDIAKLLRGELADVRFSVLGHIYRFWQPLSGLRLNSLSSPQLWAFSAALS